MLKLTLLISGNLGFELLKYISDNISVRIVSVFTDYGSKEIIKYTHKNKIKLFIGNPRKQTNKLSDFLNDIGESDIIFSINYLFIIDKILIEYPNLYALNIHGALLPKYRGRTPHVWAIINGEKKTGVTVHKIDEGVDTGDVLLQEEVEININDTGNDILNKFNLIYPLLVEKSINLVLNKKAEFIKQDETKATYFGKRTPKDGQINWDWSKERIRNWVRAQAYPYPGAFTYYNNRKLIIDKIAYSDYGFDYKIKNGKILDESNLIVKTPNGAIKIIEYRIADNTQIKFEQNTVLQ